MSRGNRTGPDPGSRCRRSTLVEFALAWPLFLLAALGAVELSVWSVEVMAARAAALAGARAASGAGAAASTGTGVAIGTLQPFLAGVQAVAWCPGDAGAAPVLWVCSGSVQGARMQSEVVISGTVPSLVPLVAGRGLPLRAHVAVPLETFS